MYELHYLYEQLKTQTLQQKYINVLNTVTESCYDFVEQDKAILETMSLIEEASQKGNLKLLQSLKTNIASAEKILSKNKEAALQCKPYGLEFKGFKTFVADNTIKSVHQKAISYLNKFDPSKASEDQLKTYIMDSSNNVQYKEIAKIMGGKESFLYKDVVIEKEVDKELTKGDISDAVKYLSTYTSIYKKVQTEFDKNTDEYTQYVRLTGFSSNRTKNKDIDELRQSASNHKRALIAIVDATYYQMLLFKLRAEFKQAKQIVVKAANHNPKNLKESADIQMYIDSMYELYEN